MKIKIILYSLLLISFSLNAQNFKSFNIISNSYVLKIGKNQGGNSKYLQYDENSKTLIRSVENPDKLIEIFNAKTGILLKTIKTNQNSLGGFCKVDENNYWIHNPWDRTYILLDTNGKQVKQFKEMNYSIEKLVYISAANFSFAPLIYYKNKIYATGMIRFYGENTIDAVNYKNAGIVERISMNGKSDFIGNPAKASLTGFYGSMNNYSMTINKNQLIVAPYFSNELQIIDLDNGKKRSLTLNLENKIKPLGSLIDRNKFSNAEQNLYFMNSYTNIGIAFDKYRNLYYKFLRFPSATAGVMMCSVIVLDKNFNVLMEQKIDNSVYSVNQYFISEKGLAFFNHKLYKADNSKIVFDVFAVKL